MKISTKSRYALRLMAEVARSGNSGKPVPLHEVARRQHLSRLYLSQLAAPLKNAALLKSVWGNKGGFLLARPPQQIRLLDVVEAVDGPICILDCVLNPGDCMRSASCSCLNVWREVNDSIVRTLANRTLADLLEPASRTGGTSGSSDSRIAG